MIIPPGSTSRSVEGVFVDDNGLPLTGKVAADFPAMKYHIAGANAVATITLSDLSALTDAYASGGIKEVAGGRYRLDVPDAAWATAGTVIEIFAEGTNKHFIVPPTDVQFVKSVDSSGNAIPTANANADALLDRTDGVETNWTLRKALRIVLAVLSGKSSGGGSVYRDTNDSKNRISSTLDSSGNRTAVTRDAT
jgi:hypothetical protein